jgi:hypothetical protein
MTQTCCPICDRAFRGHGKHPWALLFPDAREACADCSKQFAELVAQDTEDRDRFRPLKKAQYQWELKDAHARWLKRMAEYKANKPFPSATP